MRIHIQTLGCDKNTVDSECLAGALKDRGHTFVERASEADVIIVNTCGFIQDAKQQSIDAILNVALTKSKGQKLIVSGCLAQRYGDELANLIPEADFMLGVNDYDILPDLIDCGVLDSRVYVKPYDASLSEIGPRHPLGSVYTAPLRIAEGCNNACSYCSIPAIRGPYRSRSHDSILHEANDLAALGCKELVIVAQDVTAYGQDLPGEGHLVRLLQDLCHIDNIRWIRLLYCYEDRITDDLIETIRTEPKICKYIDIPLQHASDVILRAMNRHSTRKSIEATIIKLRERIPNIAIRTTMIVGFPGESACEFEELLTYIEETKFERLGVFTYSQEEGTAAACRVQQIAEAEKQRRRDEIMHRQCLISLENNKKYVGKTLEVIVDELEEDGSYVGRTQYDAPDIDNSVLFTCDEPLVPGDFVWVTITDAFDYDLVGHVIKEKTHESPQ